MRRIEIVGTAHVSRRSIEEVKRRIEEFQPDIIAVELDFPRFKVLMENRKISLRDVLGRNFSLLTLFSALLTIFQRRIGESFGVRPGEEMLQAIEMAREAGIPVLFIDRPIHITFNRLWRRMGLREKLKLFTMLLSSFFTSEKIDVEEIKDEENISAFLEKLREVSPSAARILVEERDAYMALQLLKIPEDKRVLAIVGAGHVRGIRRYLENPEGLPDERELMKI